ncbi:InlB B-repeat-containing protein [Paenibacillus filicis]|uniref:InlB B-repeat-containing protein n=1 Tax=Paenibacillus filicis TaxID=669464 RepID=A0ABU9DJR0_9BACL
MSILTVITLFISSLGLLAPNPAKAASTEDTYAWIQTATTGLSAITYGNGLYVGIQPLTGLIYTSTDLVTWTQRDVSNQTTKRLNTVKFLNGKFYAATTRDDNKAGAIFIYSNDGINWSAGSSSPAPSFTDYAFSSFAYGNNRYLVTSSNNGGVVGSSNGTVWSKTNSGYGYFYDVKYVGNRFIVAGYTNTGGSSGIVRQSTDNTGTNWGPEVRVEGTTALNGLASNGSQIIAVGSGGKIVRTDATSPDLPTVAVASPVTANLAKVAYDSSNGGLYAAVGTNNTAITSKDGLSWTKETIVNTLDASPANYTDVVYGADTFVAVASSGVYKRNLAYTVNFDSNGGTAVSSQIIPTNKTATQPPAPSKTGYTFAGWYTDRETTLSFDFAATAITSDITLYAKWTVNSYSVTFNSNGGSAVSAQSVNYNDFAQEPAAPTKEGHQFAGWYANEGLTTSFNFEATKITSNTVLYAKWTVNSYSVTFNSNGGTAVSAQSVNYNGYAQEPAAPTREGYRFAGWYANEGLTTAFNFAATKITSNTMVYANWTVNSYSVTFNSNGGTAVSPQSVNYNGYAQEPAAPTREGYRFAGWYANESLTTVFNFPATKITSNTVVYAKWTINSYAVTFNSNGGTAITPQSVNYNGYAQEPAAPTREGYQFAGWYTTASLTTAFNFAATKITSNTVLYANWTLLPLAAPAHVSAKAGDQQATIAWSAVAGATEYRVYQGEASQAYADIPVATVTGTTYNYNVVNLTNGTTYYFAIKAVNTVTSSVYSDEVAVTPAATVLPGLTAVSVSSDNPNPAFAKAGDTATLTFTANKALNGLPVVKIGVHPADVASVGNSVYKAQYTFSGSEAAGIVSFTIDFTDATGIVGDTVTSTTDGSSVIFDNTPPSGTLVINGGASSTFAADVTLTVTSTDGSGSGQIQMRFSNDNADWSAWETAAETKAWTLTDGNGTKTVYLALKDAAGNVTTQAITAIIELKTAPAPSNSSDSGGSSSKDESIAVNVESASGGNKTVVSTVIIIRSTDSNGQKKDSVVFTPEQVAKTVEQLAAAGTSTARIVIPDTKDEVSETNIKIPQDSTALLAKSSVGLEFVKNNVKIEVPGDSLQEFKDDIYFRLVPVKEEDKRKEIEQRARTEQAAQLTTGSHHAVVIGRPMSIDTNLQSRPVTLTLPLGKTSLTQQQLEDLGVFIEHSDGTKEFVQGKIVTFDESGQLGIRFSVDKFSTFTVVHIENWNTKAETHQAFISGYADGWFKPDARITRAEIAAIAAKALNKEMKPSSVSFTDVLAGHWAKAAIDRVTKMGLMEGYPDGSFKPEQTITRAELASLVARLNSDTASSSVGSFSDVDGHWAQKAIESVKGAGIINGYPDGTFRPEAELTRAEAVTMISKLLGRGPLSGAAPKWTDVPASHWAFGYIQEASVDHTVGKKTDEGELFVPAP